MAEKQWKTIKIRFCDHAECEVELEVEEILPAEFLPDQPPRLRAHRCSHGLDCNQFEKVACRWSGNNPSFDPFTETEDTT